MQVTICEGREVDVRELGAAAYAARQAVVARENLTVAAVETQLRRLLVEHPVTLALSSSSMAR